MPYHITELSASESVALFRALGSEPRARIVELLADGDMNINELSLALGLAQPSVSKHVQILEEAGLVVSDYLAGPQGMQKRCRRVHERILVEMEGRRRREDGIAEIEVPIGMFAQAEIVPTCGLATREKMIGLLDSSLSFFMPERANAEILWTSVGSSSTCSPTPCRSPPVCGASSWRWRSPPRRRATRTTTRRTSPSGSTASRLGRGPRPATTAGCAGGSIRTGGRTT